MSDYVMTCVLIGKKSVGKTSIISRMLDDNFPNHTETFGIEISSLDVELQSGATLKLNILDTGGDNSYKDIIVRYLRDVQVVVLVFSMNDISSLQHLTEWNNVLKEEAITNRTHLLLVVGNKLDLLGDTNLNKSLKQKKQKKKGLLATRMGEEEEEEEKQFASWNALEHHNMTEKAKLFSSSIGAHYIEVSAKCSQNIDVLTNLLPKLAESFFGIKPRLMTNEKRKRHLSKEIDDSSCQCIIS